MKYANKLGARYLVVLGSNELSEGIGRLKNMQTGEQKSVRLDSAEHFTADYTEITLSDRFGGV